MKKQPIEIHPLDRFMQALDAKTQPEMKEFHWEGMQALLDENFPQKEEPSAGVAESDNNPETGAAKAIKRFKWIFLGGIALIAIIAGTQWNAFAIQNARIKKELNVLENVNNPEENSALGEGNEKDKEKETKATSESLRDNKFDNENFSKQDMDSGVFNLDMNLLNSGQDQDLQNKSDEKLNLGNEITLDSVPGIKQSESEKDTALVKRKKFIFW